MHSLFFFFFPTAFIVLTLLGLLVALYWRRTGMALALTSSFCLFVAATPALSSYLLSRLEAALPVDSDFRNAQAIVVLGALDLRLGNAEVRDELGLLSIERVFMATHAYRHLRLPVAVSSGHGGTNGSEAALMKAVLEKNLAVPVAWVEDASHTTWENAVYTAKLLRSAGIRTVVLVSQAWHLPRAMVAFERAGLAALPWVGARTQWRHGDIDDFLPNLSALEDTKSALHEMIGAAYYDFGIKKGGGWRGG